jgi:predicted Zn finger-like uncharacterized protein
MPVRHKTLMGGTTLCPHCNTRFKIAEQQLEAHQGMVRCGHCLQAFDARPGYIPEQPSPQLELPILDEPNAPAEELSANEPSLDETGQALQEALPPEDPRDDLLDLNPPDAAANEPVARPKTLAEQVAIVQDEEDDSEVSLEYRRWPWAIAASLLLLALLAQAGYFFRVDLAARMPDLKPALDGYCQLLGCSVPLPQKAGLMSIESSNLDADAEHENRISLNALLRNSAPYPQAFPHLELTLNDTHDTPLARRIFKPKDYLPPPESEQTGIRPNHELNVKLHLHTADLRPTGYRLGLFYPRP